MNGDGARIGNRSQPWRPVPVSANPPPTSHQQSPKAIARSDPWPYLRSPAPMLHPPANRPLVTADKYLWIMALIEQKQQYDTFEYVTFYNME